MLLMLLSHGREWLGLISPERRLNPKLVDGLNNTTEVMAQDLAQHFVDLRRVRLAAESFTEFCLNHGEHRLDVAAPVVVRFVSNRPALSDVGGPGSASLQV